MEEKPADLVNRLERAAMAYERLGKLTRDDEKTRQMRLEIITEMAESRRALLDNMEHLTKERDEWELRTGDALSDEAVQIIRAEKAEAEVVRLKEELQGMEKLNEEIVEIITSLAVAMTDYDNEVNMEIFLQKVEDLKKGL